jgi:hypothetical protein
MIQDTSGFYKYEDANLLHGPNFVYNADYTLRREEVAYYGDGEIIDGWHWFDSIEQAQVFFGWSAQL